MKAETPGSIYWQNKILEAEQPLQAENANLRAINAELLAAAKRVLVHGANEYAAEDQLRDAIAKAENHAANP